MNTTAVAPDCQVAAWHCTAPLAPETRREIRRHLELACCKWDAQVGDTDTLAPFALVLPRAQHAALAHAAEHLAAELLAAETELLARPELWLALGLPARVRRVFEGAEPWTPTAARVIRFDFHPTDDGWRISEANGDVPGGYIEASDFTDLLAAQSPGTKSTGDPTAALVAALGGPAGAPRRIALLAAAGYGSDQQVAAHLGAALRRRGVEPILTRPESLRWEGGLARVARPHREIPVDAIFRFYQGEWMIRQRRDDWHRLFRGGRTPVCNPAAAVLTESKRLPLLWPRLDTAMPTWREFLPHTSAANALWPGSHRGRVLKAAYGNTGESVFSPGWSRPREWLAARAAAALRPGRWIAQARFRTQRVATPLGAMHPCLGVFTVNGRAVGTYGRLSAGPLIDFAAIDVAVLVAS
ncbi:MAG: hypothetical protein RLZZ15_1632 [Verrucomicrobiota bacterium]